MIINKLRVPIATAREIEDVNANAYKQRADIDYIAMMADIDIPTDDGGSENVSED